MPNPPDPTAPDGDAEEDAEELRRVGQSRARRARAHRGRALRDGARRAALGRALRLPRSATRRSSRWRSTGFALDRRSARPHPAAPAGARARAGDVRHGLLPDRPLEHLCARGRRPLPDRHLRGRARRLPHGGDPRRAAAALRGLLDLLPARVGRGRQGHARHVPRPPVQQGRAVRLLRSRARLGPRSTSGCSRSRRSSSRRSTCPTASSTSPPATSAIRPSKKYDIEAWFPSQQRYREITSTSNTTDFQARRLGIRYRAGEQQLETPHTLNGTAVTDRWLLAMLENFGGEVPEVLRGSAPRPRSPTAPTRAESSYRNPPRRGAGAVERGGLENRWARKRPVGSNPTPAAFTLHVFAWLRALPRTATGRRVLPLRGLLLEGRLQREQARRRRRNWTSR